MKRFLSASGFRAFGRTLLLCGLLPAGAAQDGHWNVDADGDWESSANWAEGTVADGAGATASFAIALSDDRSVTLTAPRAIGSLLFSDGGAVGHRWIIQGATLTLDGAAPAITAVTDAVIAAPLVGAQGLVKAGGGTLTLAGAAAYSGDTVVEAGTLRWNSGAQSMPRPLGYWPISEGSGSSISNAVTGSPAGTLVNAPAWVEGPGGPGTYAVRLNGSNQYGAIEPDAALHDLGSGTLTVSTWVNTTFTGAWFRSLVSKYGATSVIPFWGLGWISANQLGFVGRNVSGARSDVHVGAAALDGQWHHLVGVREADNTLRIYLDGALFASTSGPDGNMTNTRPIWIGRHLNDHVPAAVAGVGLWEKPLTAEDVGALYRNGGEPVPGRGALRVAAGAAFELGAPQIFAALSDHAGGGGGVLLDGHDLTVENDEDGVFSGTLSGSGDVVKLGGGTWTLAGAATQAGAVTIREGALTCAGSMSAAVRVAVRAGARFELAPAGVLHFAPASFWEVNTVAGAGEALLAGTFTIDLSQARRLPGSAWRLVDAAKLTALSYASDTFQVTGFTRDPASGRWTRTEEGWIWSFDEAEGLLTTAPVPVPPAVENRPAVAYTADSASLRGAVTDTGYERPSVTLFHGASDGGTNPALWQAFAEIGEQGGFFSTFVTNLPTGSPRYYRSRAVNSAGAAWAAETAVHTPPDPAPVVVINEFVASNRSTLADEDGDYSDWIELHNPGDTAVDLSGWGLSDNPANLFKWVFPSGTVIPARGYLLIWASGKNRPLAPIPHAGFSISAEGETLSLTRSTGVIADQSGPVVSPRDLSYGRTRSDPTRRAFLAEATPLAANAWEVMPEQIEPVLCSHASGFYTTPFSLVLNHPDPEAVIVYTLDGSEPDINNLGGTVYRYKNSYKSGPLLTNTYASEGYAGPIAIADRTSEPNRISRISSTTASNPTYFPSHLIKKATVVRARAYAGDAASPVTTATYFVSTDETAFAYDLPLVSLCVNEDAFFDYTNGIYVAGVDHVTSSGGLIGSGWANFNRRGDIAERPGHFQFFDNGVLAVDQGIGFRIHGNMSRQIAFKSLRLYASRQYDTLADIDYRFFPDPATHSVNPDERLFKRLILRNPSFTEIAFCRLYRPVYEGVGGRLQPAVQFLNGEYWGICMVRDRLDQHHLARQHGLDADTIAMVNIKYGREVGSPDLRVFDLDVGLPEDMDAFWAMRAFIIGNDMSDPANYAQACALLDTENFVHHLILKIFAGDDHYAPEYVFWKVRDPEGAGFGDGRWRVLVKDFDSTFFTSNYVTGLATGTHPRPFGFELFRSLLDNAEFRNAFINRFADLLNAHFQPQRFQEIINAAYAEVAPWWSEMTERWPGVKFTNPTDRPFTTATRDTLLSWSVTHPPRQRQHIRDHFKLSGTYNLTVDVANPDHGRIRVNTIVIDSATPGVSSNAYPWTGIYFNGIPVRLEALPVSGYRLAGWRINGGETVPAATPVLHRTLSADTALEAVFEELDTLHRWSFEQEATYLAPDLTIGGGALSVAPGALTVVSRNTAAQGFDTAHLRIQDPLGATLSLSLPTTGFEQIRLAFETRRSGSGAGTQTLAYTLDGVAWSTLASYEVLDADPQPRQFDLSGIPGVADNPLFAVRITFAQGAGGDSGNNRFDNIRLQGAALPGINRPPVVSQTPSFQRLIEEGAPLVIDLHQVFADPDGDALLFTAGEGEGDCVDLALSGNQLTVTAQRRGGTVVTLTADDGEYEISTAFRILIYPAPHALADGAYAFTSWSADEPEGVYPPHMLFLQGEQEDSELDTALEHAYHIPTNEYAAADAATIGFPYNNTSRTRINGLGAEGIAFVNTGRDRDLGGALLALDTTGLDSVRVAFTAGTVVTNLRVYAIRLQARAGIEGAFADVLDPDGYPVEYLRHSENGHSALIAPVSLPPALLDHPCVQLLWRYYRVEGDSGARAQLRLDDVRVAASDGTPASLAFDAASAAAQSGRPLRPVVVRALDAGGLSATGFNAPVTLSLTQGGGTLDGTLTVGAVDGVAVFDDLALTGTGLHRLRAAADGVDPADGALFRALSLSGTIVPAWIQGDQSSGENTNRVPFVWQARIEGLEPGAVYRYANRIAAAADTPAGDGAGNMIWITGATENWIRSAASPRFLSEDFGVRHYTLTADGDGVFRGWFITEPTGNARFTPGEILFPRLLLNDGAGGEAPLHALTADQAVTVLRFGVAAGEGSAVMGQASTSARRIAVLYADAAGEGRPLAATPVEITGAGTDERYAAFYRQVVAVSQSHWGTIIPNTLSGGVQRIEYRSATEGVLLDVLVDANGFSGTVDGLSASTRDPANGTTPLIVDSDSGLPCFLPGDSALWQVGGNWSTGTVPGGPGRAAIVNAPAAGDRNVTVNTAVTIGVLRINHSDTPYRNRFQTTSAGTFTFDGGGQAAVLRVEGGGGAGHADFDFATAVHLATDLVLLVNQADGDPEYGALRLQQRWTGSGAVVKQGPGMASLTGTGKEFTGPLLIEQGALRVTAPATPAQAASVAVQAGGQLRLASGGTAALPSVYAFGGGAIALAGMGRGGDLPPGQELGVLGALRFDPGANDSHAALANALELTAASDIHVDGTSNVLTLDGTLSGSFPLTKTGGGTLVLTAANLQPPAIVVQNGGLAIHSEHRAAIEVGAEGVLSGSGITGALTGNGTIAPGVESLTAASCAAAQMAFVFTTACTLTGNGTLVLTAAEPLPLPPATVDLYLDAEGAQPGDRFPGGPCVPFSVDLAAALSATAVRLLVADPAGELLHQGRAYRVAEAADQLSWSVADWPDGRLLEILKSGTPQLYTQWRSLNFTELSVRTDDGISGPVARPAGDNIANLTRYALAVAPYDPVDDLLPRLDPLPAGGFDYRFRLAPGLSDLAWVVRTSPDLIDWNAILFDSREEPAPPPDAGGWSSLPVPMESERLFLRLDIYLIAPDEPLP